MRYLLLLALILVPSVIAAEKANTILIHPGETLYVRFTQKGSSLKVANIAKEKDAAAQVTFTMKLLDEKKGVTLTVENRFEQDLIYKAEMRLFRPSDTPRKHFSPVVPVVGGKVSFESWPFKIDELAMTGFQLDR